MKKLIFILLILFLFSNLNAVEFCLADFKEPEFQRHLVGGMVTTGIGWELMSLLTDEKRKIEWYDENGRYQFRTERIVKPEHFMWKTFGGFLTTLAFVYITGQEPEPDIRAMTTGFFLCIGFKMAISMRWKT